MWGVWAGRTKALQGLGGVSCYIPINFSSFWRIEVYRERETRYFRGKLSGPTLEYARASHGGSRVLVSNTHLEYVQTVCRTSFPQRPSTTLGEVDADTAGRCRRSILYTPRAFSRSPIILQDLQYYSPLPIPHSFWRSGPLEPT